MRILLKHSLPETRIDSGTRNSHLLVHHRLIVFMFVEMLQRSHSYSRSSQINAMASMWTSWVSQTSVTAFSLSSRFDYIARDCHAIGEKGNLSLTRLIHSARVIDNQICYDIKDANQLYELCYTRFSLHKRIYNHKTGKLSPTLSLSVY